MYYHKRILHLISVPVLLIGLALTISRYRLTLTDKLITLRWRILPFFGWTWKLSVGEDVLVRLANRGFEQNGQPLESVVMVSQAQEINFGAFLPNDVKEYLAGAIQHYYAGKKGASAPFVSGE